MSVLKRSVFAGFILLALVSVSHAACWYVNIKPDATHCKDEVDKTWYPVGSSWTNSECVECSCSTHSHSCCNRMPTSTSKGCTIEYDYKTCTYKIINREGPGHPCAAVGK